MADRDDNARDYDVGYGKPPVATWFRKGRSGNPRGRPKGARGVRTLINEITGQEITVSEGGQSSRISKREALILSLVARALKGDMRAAAKTLRLMEANDEEIQHQQGGLKVHVIDRFEDPE